MAAPHRSAPGVARWQLLDALPPTADAPTLAVLAHATPALLFARSIDGRDAWVNRQWLHYTGVVDAPTLGARWHELTVAADVSPFAPRAAVGDECVETPFRLRDAHGELRWQLARMRLARDATGKPLLWAGVAQELAPQPSARDPQHPPFDQDDFFALVSHELRSPLNAIRGWAHVLRKSGELNAMQERALATIDRNVGAQARLIDELLDRQRLLRGRVALERRRIDLAALLDEAADSMRPAAADKQLQLTTRCDEPLLVDVDEQRLRQVLANLLSNAVKFTPALGHIELAAAQHGKSVVLEVSDSGIGLAPEWVLRAFEPVRRADGANADRPGLGLGLILAQRLVELHGGRLSAHSDGPGLGSTFRVELPAPTEVPDAAGRPSASLAGA